MRTSQKTESGAKVDDIVAMVIDKIKAEINEKKESAMFTKMAETEWLIDSGATVIVVPENSPLIIDVTDRKAEVEGLSGIEMCKIANIMTPFGPLVGRISKNAPHLLPLFLINEAGGSIQWQRNSDLKIVDLEDVELDIKKHGKTWTWSPAAVLR